MAKIASLKLKQQAEAGATMLVRDPFGERDDDGDLPLLRAADGTPASLTLLGADSTIARRMDYQRAATAQNRISAAMLGRGKAKAVVTPEDIAEQAAHDIDRLVALTVGWHGFEDEDDQPVPFSAEAVRELYEQNPLIREQAFAFLADRARFFGRSSTLSAPSSSTNFA